MKAITVATDDPIWQELARIAAARVFTHCAGITGVEVVTVSAATFNRDKIAACANAKGPTMFFDADLFFIAPCDPSEVLTPGLISAAHAYIPGCTTVKKWAADFDVDPILWINSGLMIFDDSAHDPLHQALELKGNDHEYGDEVFINKALAQSGHPTRMLSPSWNYFIGAKPEHYGFKPGPIRALHATGIRAAEKLQALQTFTQTNDARV
jgi:hypothetical protein